MTTLESVIQVVARQLDKDPALFNETTDLQEAGFESLDFVEVVFALEEAFNISISFNASQLDSQNIRTVGDIVTVVDREIGRQKAS